MDMINNEVPVQLIRKCLF